MKTILVAEDESDVRRSLGVALACDGFNVEFAENGEEVLERARSGESDFALIVLDVRMPRKDGLKTLQEVQRIRPDIPVIMLSGAYSPVIVVTAMNAGAIDFLSKPVHHGELSKAIRRALQIPGGDRLEVQVRCPASSSPSYQA
jgi:DNA-binding NtrC family response regulator